MKVSRAMICQQSSGTEVLISTGVRNVHNNADDARLMFLGLNEFYNSVRMLLALQCRRVNVAGAVLATEISMSEWNDNIDCWILLCVVSQIKEYP